MRNKKNILSEIIFIVVFFSSCNFSKQEIQKDKVQKDEKTNIYTFKNNGEKVTGTVISEEVEHNYTLKVVQEIVNGYCVSCTSYYPSGKKRCEYKLNQMGEIEGDVIWYFENGQIDEITPFKNNVKNGISKRYNNEGIQISEIIFEAGNEIKKYEFDNSGNKIVPAIDKLELYNFESGFYENADFNSNQILYQPIIILKWKNISKEPLTETIEIQAIFINEKKQEELSNIKEYFQGYSDAPLQPGLSRQISLQSSVGLVNNIAISNANISCQILINNQPYKTFKIKNTLLSTNRIQ